MLVNEKHDRQNKATVRQGLWCAVGYQLYQPQPRLRLAHNAVSGAPVVELDPNIWDFQAKQVLMAFDIMGWDRCIPL